MSDPRQQKRFLAVLLVVLVGFVTYRTVQFTSGPGSAAARAGRADSVDSALADIEVPHLDLGLLQREAATYRPGRDPFRFGAAPPPPKPKPVPAVRPPQPVERPKPAPKVAQTPPAPPAPRPPQVDFVYLGSFGPSDRRIAVFTKNEEIFNVLTGEVLLEKFIVDKIGFESADIKFVGFPEAPGTRLEAGG